MSASAALRHSPLDGSLLASLRELLGARLDGAALGQSGEVGDDALAGGRVDGPVLAEQVGVRGLVGRAPSAGGMRGRVPSNRPIINSAPSTSSSAPAPVIAAFESVLDALRAAGATVYAPDLRGHGSSGRRTTCNRL